VGSPLTPNDSPLFRRDVQGPLRRHRFCRGGIAGRWTKPGAAPQGCAVLSGAKLLSRTLFGELYRGLTDATSFISSSGDTILNFSELGMMSPELTAILNFSELGMMSPELTKRLLIDADASVNRFDYHA